MELREFAERVLFARTLEEKLLAPPDDLVDEHRGPAIEAPPMPGRPRDLEFKAQGVARDEFPGVERLEQERERGRLLHFFANHELLATELMALVLLRFPDAPAAFRRGVLATLKDEQEHTRLYMDRMRSCGIAFGEIPVSGFFWRSVSGMENPMDYVAGLCLTFEQANLDHARHFAQGFAKVGDAETSKLLERIYRDEIGHVAYGLKWFRRWKNPSETDWDAFCRQLKFPLTPQRAKGLSVNFAGRRAAGLDPRFIAELEVFALSRGRTPGVFLFNPFTEGFIARGAGFAPVKTQQQLAADLANLPQFLCRQDDIVLVPERPAVEFLAGIKRAGFPLPEFIESAAGSPLRIEEPGTQSPRKLGRLRPWAWGPDSVARLGPLFSQVTGEPRAAGACFNNGIADVYSKPWSADLLRETLGKHGPAAWLCDEEVVGVAASSVDDALAAVATIRARGHHRIVVKEAFGLAGHNAIRLWEPAITEAQRTWIESAVRDGRSVVVEPWLDRVMDFSLQLEMGERVLAVVGYTGLVNDAKGQFRANWAAPNHARRLPAQVIAALEHPRAVSGDGVSRETADPGGARPPRLPRPLHGSMGRLSSDARPQSRQVNQFFEMIRAALECRLAQIGYQGPVGIDAFVYRDASGRSRLKPIVEINPRTTMGRLTLELMKQAVPGRWGAFRLVNRAMLRAAGCSSFVEHARRCSEERPLQFEGEPVARISEGFLSLNDPAAAKVCAAVFEVSRDPPPEVVAPC